MSLNNAERMPFVTALVIGTQAATKTLPGAYFRKKTRIKNVHVIDQAGVAADNTNFLQVSLQDLSGNVYASYDTRAANQGALTAMTPGACLKNTTYTHNGLTTGELEVPAGTTLQIVVTKNGTGVPTLATLQVEGYSL